MDNFGAKMMNKFFRPVDNVVWDLMSGRIGVKTNEGIITLEGEGNEAQVVQNMFDEFGMALPAFAQNTPVDQIKQGDLIYGQNKILGWVVKCPTVAAVKPSKKKGVAPIVVKPGVAFTLLKPDGTRGEWRPPKVQSIGLDMNGAMVLRSLINVLPGGSSGLPGLQNMLLPMMAMGGDMGEMGNILPMMLFTQMNGAGTAAAGANPMAQMMPMLMMMKMMGKGGDNPMAAMFGGSSSSGTGTKRPSFFDRKGE